MKSKWLSRILFLSAGITIGVIITSSLIIKYTKTASDLVSLSSRAWEANQAINAYQSGNPQIARYALNHYAEILNFYYVNKTADSFREATAQDLAFTYIRLGNLAKTNNKANEAEQLYDRAHLIYKQYRTESGKEVPLREKLIESVNRLDDQRKPINTSFSDAVTGMIQNGREELLNIPVIVGLITTFLLGCLVGTIVKATKALIPPSPPKANLKDKWQNLTKDSSEMFNDGKKHININEVLGLFERFVFFIAFWLGKYEIIGGWLAFKVASKWEVWSNIVAFPKELKEVDGLDYLIARRRLGAQIFTTFLVGTLANAIAAFLGTIVGQNAVDFYKNMLGK